MEIKMDGLRNEHAVEIQEMQERMEQHAEKEREMREEYERNTRENAERDDQDASLRQEITNLTNQITALNFEVQS